MSKCYKCGEQWTNENRIETPLLCPKCELAAPAGWDAAHQLDIYLEALRNLETAQGHARLGHFDSAAFNCRMAAEKFFAIYEARQQPNAALCDGSGK